MDLTGDQIEQLRTLLCGEQAALERALLSLDEGAKTVDLDEPIGRLSRMDAIQQQKMSAANKASSERRLVLIARALERIDEDDYGYCLKCDEPVGFKRLRARPETLFCVSCQSQAEG